MEPLQGSRRPRYSLRQRAPTERDRATASIAADLSQISAVASRIRCTRTIGDGRENTGEITSPSLPPRPLPVPQRLQMHFRAS